MSLWSPWKSRTTRSGVVEGRCSCFTLTERALYGKHSKVVRSSFLRNWCRRCPAPSRSPLPPWWCRHGRAASPEATSRRGGTLLGPDGGGRLLSVRRRPGPVECKGMDHGLKPLPYETDDYTGTVRRQWQGNANLHRKRVSRRKSDASFQAGDTVLSTPTR